MKKLIISFLKTQSFTVFYFVCYFLNIVGFKLDLEFLFRINLLTMSATFLSFILEEVMSINTFKEVYSICNQTTSFYAEESFKLQLQIVRLLEDLKKEKQDKV